MREANYILQVCVEYICVCMVYISSFHTLHVTPDIPTYVRMYNIYTFCAFVLVIAPLSVLEHEYMHMMPEGVQHPRAECIYSAIALEGVL